MESANNSTPAEMIVFVKKLFYLVLIQ